MKQDNTTNLELNLACLGLTETALCIGERVGGERGDVSPSSGMFSSSSLMEGRVSEGTPFISDSCCNTIVNLQVAWFPFVKMFRE